MDSAAGLWKILLVQTNKYPKNKHLKIGERNRFTRRIGSREKLTSRKGLEILIPYKFMNNILVISGKTVSEVKKEKK